MRKYNKLNKIYDNGRFVAWKAKSVPRDGGLSEDGDLVRAAAEDCFVTVDRNRVEKSNFQRQCRELDKVVQRIERFNRPEIVDNVVKVPGSEGVIPNG